jgi:hypothetical protein
MKKNKPVHRRAPALVDRTARRKIGELHRAVDNAISRLLDVEHDKRALASKVRTVEEAAERILLLRQAALESTEADLNTRLLHENQSLLEVVSQMRRVLIEHGLLR